MWISIGLLLIGFIVLIKGADVFVDAASSIAENLHLSKMLIALTIVAFGTSAPEFAVSVKSLLAGSGDIVLGNVIGSNILNILLILGVSACIHPLRVSNATVKKELPITLLMTSLIILLISDSLLNGNQANFITRSDGMVIFLVFGVFIYYLISMMRNKVDKEEQTSPKYKMGISILLTMMGIAALIIGSNLVVDQASFIAQKLGVSERIISLTIIALGTSLPELVTSVMATKKGEYDIAIGNVVGSNIFNIGMVIGLPVSLLGGIGKVSFGLIDIGVFFLAALLLFLFSYKDHKISKVEGMVFLFLFVSYFSYLFI